MSALLPLSGFVYSAEVGFVKSDPRFFAAAQQQLGLPLDMSRVVFVDDSMANVRSAQEAHWHAVHFGSSFDWHEHVEAFLLLTNSATKTAGSSSSDYDSASATTAVP